MDVKVSSVSRETIRTRAEASLREAIVDGRLGSGERLIERELCEALQVSRGSLREALRGLIAEGLIEVVPHRGPVVARITAEQAREIYAVRGVLEGLAARTLAQHPDPRAIDRMTSALERMRDIRTGIAHSANLIPVKTEFYSALFEGAGNLTLAEMMNRLLARISVLRRTSFSRPDRLSQSIIEITRIVEAIRAGDADEAERATRHHVEQACLAALPLLPSSPPTPRRDS